MDSGKTKLNFNEELNKINLCLNNKDLTLSITMNCHIMLQTWNNISTLECISRNLDDPLR